MTGKIAIAGYEEKISIYVTAVRALGLEPVAVLDNTDISAFSGLILPGGGDVDPSLYGCENDGSRNIDLALDQAQLSVTDAFVRAGKPVLGICRGAQVLNVYFGGTLIQDLATAESHLWHDEPDGSVRYSAHPCVNAEDGLLHRLYGCRRMPINSAHHQSIARLGDGLRATSWADDGVVELAEHRNLPVIAAQFHPEHMAYDYASPDIVDGAVLLEYFRSLLGTDTP